MKVSDFNYDLPEELIAKYPLPDRSDSRLLTLDGASGAIQHRQFCDIDSLVSPGDLLIFNDTKVVPARLFGKKQTGGHVEILFERKLDEHRFLAHVRSSKSPKPGSKIVLESGRTVTMVERKGSLFVLEVDARDDVFSVLDGEGHIPLPPYIDRNDEAMDNSRYQTVYARKPGAAAAPTAGLHFDQATLARLEEMGVAFGYVTLHVGAGTFQPVKVESVTDHHMHSEWIDVSAELVDRVHETKRAGGRVIAVGTTSMRSLESAALTGGLEPYRGDTDIFIFPGFEFKVVDALITNFHLPKSTLLMLVSAFSGKDNIERAYQEAIDRRYRFFSYGDAMFLMPTSPSRLTRQINGDIS